MRLVAAMLAVVAVVVAGIAIFAMVNLRTLVAAHQNQLVARVERLLGRSVTVGTVVPSWWPLGVRLGDVTIGEDAAFGTEPFLSADAVVMSVRAWPLVRGRIEAAGLDLDRPSLRLVRDADGRWNVASLGEPPASASANGARDGRERRTVRIPMEWAIGVALSNVRAGTVALEDRAGGRDRQLTLRHVRLRAENVQLGATARVRLDAAVFAAAAPDLHLDLQVPSVGQHDAEHAPFTARVDLRGVDLAAARQLLGWETAVAGRVEHLEIEGDGPLTDLRVRTTLRATDRALRIGRLPVGAAVPVILTGEGTRAGERVTIGDLRATLGGLELEGKGEGTIAPWRLALTMASTPGGSLALGGWQRPVLLEAVDGRVVIDRDGIALEPLRDLDPIRHHVEEVVSIDS